MFALIFALACTEDVAKDKPAAEVAPAGPITPPPAGEPGAAPAAGGGGPALPVDAARSSVKAVGAKVTASHELTFSDFSGAVRLDGENFAGVEVKVGVASVATDSEKLVEHLKTEDFFAVGQYPDATFTSTSVTAGGEGGTTHTVTGNLTLRGVTKEIRFPATVAVRGEAVEAKAEFSIVRADFGIVYPGKPDNLIQDKVLMKIELVSPRGPATAPAPEGPGTPPAPGGPEAPAAPANPAESGSLAYRLFFRVRLLSTPPRGDAVTFRYVGCDFPQQGLSPC